MRIIIAILAGLIASIALSPAYAKNYNQVVCDDEPDPVQCALIQNWYVQARTNEGGSCCGLGDAYWTDQIDKVVTEGLYVTVTDDRSCKSSPPPYDDEAGAPSVDQEQINTGCIRKIDLNGRHLWIPNDKIDHYLVTDPIAKEKRRQGNPTGHTIVFVNPTGSALIYAPDGKQYLAVYCFMPGVGG